MIQVLRHGKFLFVLKCYNIANASIMPPLILKLNKISFLSVVVKFVLSICKIFRAKKLKLFHYYAKAKGFFRIIIKQYNFFLIKFRRSVKLHLIAW